jgi:hypothetical protein
MQHVLLVLLLSVFASWLTAQGAHRWLGSNIGGSMLHGHFRQTTMALPTRVEPGEPHIVSSSRRLSAGQRNPAMLGECQRCGGTCRHATLQELCHLHATHDSGLPNGRGLGWQHVNMFTIHCWHLPALWLGQCVRLVAWS